MEEVELIANQVIELSNKIYDIQNQLTQTKPNQ